MKLKTAFFFAIRSVFGRSGKGKRYLWGAMAGIGFSLVPLLVTIEIADGMIEGITSRFIELGTYHIQVSDFTYSDIDQISLQRDLLRLLPEVTNAWVEKQGIGVAVSGEKRTGVTVRAVEPAMLKNDRGFTRYLNVVEGEFSLDGKNRVLVGQSLAAKLGVNPGSPLFLMTMTDAKGGLTIPRLTRFTVAGIVSAGYQDLDEGWMFVSLEAGFPLLPPDSSRQFIGIKTKDPFADLTGLNRRISQMLPRGYRSHTWLELQKSQYMSLQTTKTLLFFIMALLVLVAGANVSSALIMLSLEKQPDIAILKSMGASPPGIFISFLSAGFFVGFLGTSMGIALGLFAAVNINEMIRLLETVINYFMEIYSVIFSSGQRETMRILNPQYYLETIPIRLDFVEVFAVCAGTLIVSLLAAAIPAHRAGRFPPLEIMRKH